uniref:Uncharacterized protein n=1 Tax=Romanomermis culicivorax TaxID=13658 RepID=A0A915KQD8_ROMCU
MRARPMRKFACSDTSVEGMYRAREYRVGSGSENTKSGQRTLANQTKNENQSDLRLLEIDKKI